MAHERLLHGSLLWLSMTALACTTDVDGGGGFGSGASAGDDADTDGGSDQGEDGDGASGPLDGGGSTGGADGGTTTDSAGDDASSDDGTDGGPGPGQPGGDPGDGPCGCGFPAWACETDFYDPEGTEGPMPPLCGGGSGLSDGPPNTCVGGNFGTYSDVGSFCTYVANRWAYLENECGNFGTATLTIDPALGAIAQAEAEAVADGADPKGQILCGGSPCGPLDGPRFNLGAGASWFYIDGFVGQYLAKDAMFTAPETNMIIQSNAVWQDQQGNPIYERACQYNTEFSNAILYHYCNWEGMGIYGDPSTQPTRVGCGVAVDTEGITWRVVKLGE